MLLSAGTVVDVSKETAAVILKLGRCELFEEKEAVKKADTAEEKSEPKVEKPKVTKTKAETKPKATKTKATKKTD